MCSLWRGLLISCLIVGFTCNSVVSAETTTEGYQLGRGYPLGGTGIRLGGYASTNIQGLGILPWSFEVHDLSLFTSWNNGQRLSFFSELEVEGSLTAGEHQSLTTDKAHFLVERLYLDYRVNDTLVVRLGKILTPVGQWNLIHAQPLVWTSTRPVVTQSLFSEHATGTMLYGSIPIGEKTLEYSVYGDYSSTLDPKKAEPPNFDNALGLRLRYNLTDNLLLGLSYADFALMESPNIRNHLVGLDIAWDYQDFSTTGEIVYRNNEAPFNNQAWQGYLQGVAPVIGHVYAIGRYEFFDQANDQFGQVGVLGLAYRPKPPLTFKLEYRFGENNKDLAPDGLFASLAVLF
jgi:hypothetical protein